MGVTWTYEPIAHFVALTGFFNKFKYHEIFWLHVPYGLMIRAKENPNYSRSGYFSWSRIDETIGLYDSNFELSPDLKNWLKANQIGYRFTGVNLQYRLEIDTAVNAMKFKLRWC